MRSNKNRAHVFRSSEIIATPGMSLTIEGNSNSVEDGKKSVNEAIAAPAKKQGIVLGPGEVEVSIELGRAVDSVIGKGGSNVIRIETRRARKLISSVDPRLVKSTVRLLPLQRLRMKSNQ